MTGGTRDIGTATSVTLKEKKLSVAAFYAGNGEAANAFKEETGIPIYKTDVSDLAACGAGIAQIVADFSPINVLVNAVAPGHVGTDMVQSVPPNILAKLMNGFPQGVLALPTISCLEFYSWSPMNRDS